MELPALFLERIQQFIGDEFTRFVESLSTPPVTSVRVNNKTEMNFEGEKVKWCPDSYYLNERPLFTADPLFHAGAYYVQEASSMFLYQALNQCFKDANYVLDLCAAPGGKSTLLSQFLSSDSLLVANEIVRSRANILSENLSKWGNTNYIVTNSESSDFLKINNFFDAIVVDAPCSGEGMFRKDAGAVKEWSVDNVNLCASRQKEIVRNVWDALKPGGILVYSTCTYNKEENECNVEWICEELEAECLKLALNELEDIVETEFGYRFFPHKTKGEGFFLSVIRKKGELFDSRRPKVKLKKAAKILKSSEIPFELLNPSQWTWVNDNNHIRAYKTIHFETLMYLSENLRCMDCGLYCGEVKGKDVIPSAQLALSKALNTELYHSVELSYEQAIAYLKKEPLFINNSPNGYLLVVYKGVVLGWVKNLGSRANNLYPTNWRIRMNL